MKTGPCTERCPDDCPYRDLVKSECRKFDPRRLKGECSLYVASEAGVVHGEEDFLVANKENRFSPWKWKAPKNQGRVKRLRSGESIGDVSRDTGISAAKLGKWMKEDVIGEAREEERKEVVCDE